MSEVKDTLDHVNASTLHSVEGVPTFVVPNGHQIVQLENLLDKPRYFERDLSAQDADTLIAYALHHGNKNGFASAVFHDLNNQKFTVVLDNDGAEDAAGDIPPAWMRHTARYQPVKSDEYRTWLAMDGKWLGQKDLAELFEDREDDFVQPTGVEIYQLVTNLTLKRNVTVASAIDQNDGTFAIQYAEEKGKGTVELPDTLTLGVAPFKNGDRYKITAKLRYRLNDGQVAFQIKLRNPERVLDIAFREIAEKIKEKLPALEHYNATAW